MKRYGPLFLICALLLGPLNAQSPLTMTGAGPGKVAAGGGGGLDCSALDSQSVTDDFNRIDNSDLGTNWTAPMRNGNNPLNIDSNLASPGAGTSSEHWNVTTFKDPTAYIQLRSTSALGTNDQLRFGFNLVDGVGTTSMDGYFVEATKAAGTDSIVLRRVDSNSLTSLTPTTGTTAQEFDNTDWVGFVRVDSVGLTRICFKDSAAGTFSELATYTDSTYTTAGNVGIGIATGVDIRLDNFSIAAH
jgi:hypothetical protein